MCTKLATGSVPKQMSGNYRMAQPTQWVPAILDYMKKAKSNISTCLA